jgi:hypothetical protein
MPIGSLAMTGGEFILSSYRNRGSDDSNIEEVNNLKNIYKHDVHYRPYSQLQAELPSVRKRFRPPTVSQGPDIKRYIK